MERYIVLVLLAAMLLSLLTGCAGHGSAEAEGGDSACYVVGHAKVEIPVDLESETYYVAGYRNDMKATGQLDPQMVHAVVIDDNTGAGPIVLISVDCVALSSADTERIRKDLKKFCRETDCRGIHIMSTHDHAGADTLGLWGPVGMEGKNGSFMQDLRNCCVQAVTKAYENRTEGDLYFGYRDTSEQIPNAPQDIPFITYELQEDTRRPNVYDSNIYSFRFVPYDEEKTVLRIVNYASHAESLDGDNSLLSADFPAYAAKILAERENSELVWFPGAIGGLLRTHFRLSNRVDNCKLTGQIIAAHILAIDNEVKLEPSIQIDTVSLEIPCENPLFLGMKFLGILESKATAKNKDVYLCSEMSLLQLGEKKILLIPGEIFPELVYGNDTDFQGNFPEKTIETLCSVLGDDLLIFGLADDEVGYIVPPSDFMLSEEHPYLDRVRDKYGEDHYEETNSCGPQTAGIILEAAKQLKERAEKKK